MQDYFKYSNMDRNIIWGYECYSMLFDAFHDNHRVSMADAAYLCTSVIFNPDSLKSVVCMQGILSKLPSNWVFAIADCMTADTIWVHYRHIGRPAQWTPALSHCCHWSWPHFGTLQVYELTWTILVIVIVSQLSKLLAKSDCHKCKKIC